MNPSLKFMRGDLATISSRNSAGNCSNPTPMTSRRTPELRSATSGPMYFGMPGVVCSAIASQTCGICAIDLEALVWARKLLYEAEIVKCGGDVQKLTVEAQIPLTTLLSREQVDTDRVIK